MFRKKRLFITIFSAVLLCFTVYVIADTFLITRVYSSVEVEEHTGSTVSVSTDASSETSDYPGYTVTTTGGQTSGESSDTEESTEAASASDTTGDAAFTSEKVVTDDTYTDENIRISLQEYDVSGTAVYVADVTVSDPSYLKTAFASSAYGRNVTDETSDIADSVNAILAINGDFYGSQESGYVIRNGELYRNTAERGQEDLVIYQDGSFGIIEEEEVSAEELLEAGAVQVLSFGPALVQNGSITVSENEEVGRAMNSNPRTAIGIIDELHYVFVVSDGRTSESKGLSLYELAEFMESLGVQTAYNLDGGGSSTMYFNGQVVNNPTSGHSIKERKVSDIVYIG